MMEVARRKYIHHHFDRLGRECWYVRIPGQPKTRLPGGPTHPHFEKAYQAAIAGRPLTRAPRTPEPKGAKSKHGYGYVYFLQMGARVKIGHSRNPLKRLDELSTALSDRITSFVFMPGSIQDERGLHRAVESRRTSGEWYRADGLLIRLMAHAAAYGRLPADFAGLGAG